MDFKGRRNNLRNRLGSPLIVLFSGYEVQKSADEAYPFEVNRNFYYLTGIDQSNTYLIIDGEKEFLYVNRNNKDLEKWIGSYLSLDEAREISQVEDVRYNDNIEEEITLLAAKHETVFLDLEKSDFLGGVNQGQRLSSLFKNANNKINICDVYFEIIKMRMIKDDDEVNLLSRAIDITNQSLIELMKELPSFNSENQCQAKFEERILALAGATTSFPTIASSGKNATILHYSENNATLDRQNLILFDLGARYHYYCADISRTYPLGGKYNDIQRDIYELVLYCNKKIISLIKPGLTIRNLQEYTKIILADGLKELKLIENDEELDKYYFHNISHHLGLDTHDPCISSIPLEKGNVITVEPGLYIDELGIGVRIEDDVLITEDGCINLSQKIVKEVNDIERIINEK